MGVRILDRRNRLVGVNKYLRTARILIVFLWWYSSGAQCMNKPSVSHNAPYKQCVGNLQLIYRMLKADLHHSGGIIFPPDLTGVYLMTGDPKLLICSADKGLENTSKPDTFRTSYELVNNPLEPKIAATLASRIAIVIEKRANHSGQRLVLFYDGSVKAFNNQQFDRLKSNSFIDAETVDAK
jgi:hypothetical protein